MKQEKNGFTLGVNVKFFVQISARIFSLVRILVSDNFYHLAKTLLLSTCKIFTDKVAIIHTHTTATAATKNILYNTILYTLYYTILYYTILILYYTILYYTILYYIYFILLYYIIFFFFILWRKKRHGNIPLRRKGNQTICSIALFSLVLCFDQFCIYFPK